MWSRQNILVVMTCLVAWFAVVDGKAKDIPCQWTSYTGASYGKTDFVMRSYQRLLICFF